MERFTNDATTTLSSGVNNSSNPVTVAVASATLFPSAGNFHIRIDDEILLVTAVSGTNFTASRAQEGTTIATHSSGAAVALVLTSASLDNTVKDRFKVGALTDYAGANAAFYQGNDAPVAVLNQTHMIASPYIPIRTWDADAYTWFSQGTSSYVKNSDFMATFTVPTTSGEQLRGMHIATSGSKTIDAWFSSILLADSVSAYNLMGINIGNGSDAKKYTFRVMDNATSVLTTLFQYFSDDNTGVTTFSQYRFMPCQPVGLRMVYNSGGNTIVASISQDGVNWSDLGTASSVSSNFTPNRMGVHFENNSGIPAFYNVSNVYIR